MRSISWDEKCALPIVGRSHALLELEAAWIVLGRDLALGLRAGHDNDAWHELLAFGVNGGRTTFGHDLQPAAAANPPPAGDVADRTPKPGVPPRESLEPGVSRLNAPTS